MEQSVAVKFAQLASVSSSFFVSGFSFSASYLSLPAIASSPVPLRLKQWLKIYDLGKLVAPPLGVTGGLAWAYLAWFAYPETAWKTYAAAGVATFGGTLLWTVVVMRPTNQALMEMAMKGGEGADDVKGKVDFEKRAEQELGKWDRMNLVRTVVPLVGGLVGLWGML